MNWAIPGARSSSCRRLAARRNVGIRTLQFLSRWFLWCWPRISSASTTLLAGADIVPASLHSFCMPSGHAHVSGLYGLREVENSWIRHQDWRWFCIGFTAFLDSTPPADRRRRSTGYPWGLFSRIRSETKEKSLTPWWELGCGFCLMGVGVFCHRTITLADSASGCSARVPILYGIPTITWRIIRGLFAFGLACRRDGPTMGPKADPKARWWFGIRGHWLRLPRNVFPPSRKQASPDGGWVMINFIGCYGSVGLGVQWIHSRYCHACPSGH